MESGLRILPVKISLRIINRILDGCGVLTFTDEGTQDRTFTFASVPFRFEMPAPDEAAKPDRYCLPGVRSSTKLP